MKTLLIAPAVRPALPQLAEDRPLATVPILGECLVNHWVEHVAMLGAKHVIILASDRADEVADKVKDGERWGVKVEVIRTATEFTVAEATALYQVGDKTGWLPAPHDILVMSHLPGCPEKPLFESHASWFAAVLGWMPHSLTPARVRVTEIRPGIWVGRRSRISSSAKLIAPCWIGDQVMVGPNAIVGGGAVVEDRSVIEAGARVVLSYVSADTFVGRMTLVSYSLALGGTLVNWRTDSSLRVPDPFMLCSLAPSRGHTPGFFVRLRNTFVRVVTMPYAFLTGWTRTSQANDVKLSG